MRLSFIYKRLPPLTASLFTNVCRLFLHLSEHVCRFFDTLLPEICRKIEIRGITPQTSLRRRPIVKNLASIALAIAVLCVANYAGAHETSGHNARTSHAASRSHRWHNHYKKSDTMWFNFAFDVIDPSGDNDGARDDDDRTFDRWRDRDPNAPEDEEGEDAILEGSPIYNDDGAGRVKQIWYMPHIHWNHEHPDVEESGTHEQDTIAGELGLGPWHGHALRSESPVQYERHRHPLDSNLYDEGLFRANPHLADDVDVLAHAHRVNGGDGEWYVSHKHSPLDDTRGLIHTGIATQDPPITGPLEGYGPDDVHSHPEINHEHDDYVPHRHRSHSHVYHVFYLPPGQHHHHEDGLPTGTIGLATSYGPGLLSHDGVGVGRGAEETSQQETLDDSSDDQDTGSDPPQEKADDSSDDQDTGSDPPQEKSDDSSDDSGAGGDPPQAKSEESSDDSGTGGDTPQAKSDDSGTGGNAPRGTSAGDEPAAPQPQTLTIVSGDGQQGPAGATLAASFVISVLDQDGSAFAGAAVSFSVAAGGGTLSAATATTDASGQASTTLTLGSTPGSNSVTAMVAGLGSATFTATGYTTPHSLTIVSGDGQQGPAGAQLDAPFVVSVSDENGAALAGAAVSFSVAAGGGTLTATTATTNANGRAATTLRLGSTPGDNTVEATVAGLDAGVTFSATGQETDLAGFDDFFSSGKLAGQALEGPQLLQNAPNPFNSQTVLSYFLLKSGSARLEVFALSGQRVAVLHQGPQQAGLHRLHWDGRDAAGRPVASGAYLYRLVTEEVVLTRKLILLR